MQIHDTANSRFSKLKIEEFWRMVEGIKWEEGRNAETIKMDLMKIMTPSYAEINKRIAYFYMLHLVDEFKKWHHHDKNEEKYDVVDLEFAASNVIGGGKFNYDQIVAAPQYLANEVSIVSIEDNFLKCLPTDDDYYS